MRLALRHGVTFQQFHETVKRAFVESAAHDLKAIGAKQNVSRVSVITGIHRNEVGRILDAPPAPDPEPSLAARVLSLWEQHPDFQASKGKPKVLNFRGPNNEFEGLVKRVSSHLNYATVLFELTRMNAVEKTKKGLVLKKASVDSTIDHRKAFELLARDFSALTGTLEANLSPDLDPKNLHIRTEYDNVPEHHLPVIKQFVLEEGRVFHRKMREQLSQYDADVNPPPVGSPKFKRMKVVVTAFFNSELAEENK